MGLACGGPLLVDALSANRQHRTDNKPVYLSKFRLIYWYG